MKVADGPKKTKRTQPTAEGLKNDFYLQDLEC